MTNKLLSTRKKLDKKGFTIQELLIVMMIIAILFAAGFIGRSIYIERAKMTNLKSDFNNYEYAIQQAVLENPTMSLGRKFIIKTTDTSKSLTYAEAAKVTDTTITNNTTDLMLTGEAAQLYVINKYLSEEIRFSPGTASAKGIYTATKKLDPWDMSYILLFHNNNITATGESTDADKQKDAEFRVFVKSYGKNNKTSDITKENLLDNDDCVTLIQAVNADVTTATRGLDRNKGNFQYGAGVRPETANATGTGGEADPAADSTNNLYAAYTN